MMDTSKIRWTNKIPDKKIEVVAPKPGQTLKVIAAGALVGVMVHWHEDLKATSPCICDADDLTHRGLPECDWRGYLPAVTHSSRRIIVEITSGAAANCPRIKADDIVGLWISVERRGKEKNSPVYCWFAEHALRATDVKPFDPIPRLLEMWGFTVPAVSLPPIIVNGRDGGHTS